MELQHEANMLRKAIWKAIHYAEDEGAKHLDDLLDRGHSISTEP